MNKSAIISLLLFFTFSFLFHSDNSFDQDLGRHIKLGEIIWQTKTVPATNLFSYTFPNFPFLNHHWGFELLAYWAFFSLPEASIIIIKIIILITAVGLVLGLVEKKSLLTLPIAFIFLHLLRERTELRPEIFSFLYTSLMLLVLEKWSAGKWKWGIYFLPLIQLLWVNTHIYFPLGLILQGIYLVSLFVIPSPADGGVEGSITTQTKMSQIPPVSASWRIGRDDKVRTLFVIFVLSITACLFNPNGLKGTLYPFQIFGNFGYSIEENQNIFLLESLHFQNPNFFFLKLAILISLISVVVAFLKKTLTLKNFSLVVLGVVLGLINVRSMPYLIFIALPAVINNFGEVKLPKPLKLLIVLILFFESFFYLSGTYYLYTDSSKTASLDFAQNLKPAMDFVTKFNLPAPIFNNFDIGSYISYVGFPKYRVFVDGRPEAYPPEFFTDVYIPMQEEEKKFAEESIQYGFGTIIFSITDQTPWGLKFLSQISKNESWKLIFLDQFVAVFVTEEVAKERNLATIDRSHIKVDQFNYSNHANYLNLSLFLLNIGFTDQAKEFAGKTLKLFPDSPRANLIMASILGQSESLFEKQQAQKYLEKSKNWVVW